MSARFTSKIKDIDPRAIEQLAARLEMENRAVNIGFPANIEHKNEDGSPSPFTVAQIAAVHEFGSPEAGIPERSFLRSAIQENRQKYFALNKKILLGILAGKGTVLQGLGMLGNVAVGDVKKKIAAGPFEALNKTTIKRKGSSKPLIDSGQMRQSVQWTLVKQEGDE